VLSVGWNSAYWWIFWLLTIKIWQNQSSASFQLTMVFSQPSWSSGPLQFKIADVRSLNPVPVPRIGKVATWCKICRTDFPDLKSHFNLHKKHSCIYCGKCFLQRSDCSRHTLIHTNERPFVCEECGGSFKRSYEKTRHIRECHGYEPVLMKRQREPYNRIRLKKESTWRLIMMEQVKKTLCWMRNLIIDGAAGGETKRRHDVTFPLLTLHRGKCR
jgi:uncharacterized Zn-finger protein